MNYKDFYTTGNRNLSLANYLFLIQEINHPKFENFKKLPTNGKTHYNNNQFATVQTINSQFSQASIIFLARAFSRRVIFRPAGGATANSAKSKRTRI